MSNPPDGDPFGWNEGAVCQYLGDDTLPWVQIRSSISKNIQEQNIDGRTLLTYDILVSKQELMEKLGISLARHRVALVELIFFLRSKSTGFRAWKADIAKYQEDAEPDGNDTSLKDTSYPTFDSNVATATQPQHVEDIERSAEASTDQPRPAKRKRLAPVQLETKPVSEFPQPILTEADFLSNRNERDANAYKSKKLPWETSLPGAYLGDGALPPAAIVSVDNCLSTQLTELGDDSFALNALVTVPCGRRKVVERAMRRFFIRNSRKETLFAAGLSPTETASDNDDEILDLIDPAEPFDEQTEREIEAEELENAQLEERRRGSLLSNDRIRDVLAGAMESMTANWQDKKLPKYQRKAYGAWKEARRKGTKANQILKAREQAQIYDKRVKKLCANIMGEIWTKEADVVSQSRCLEQSVEDKLHYSWLADMLESRIEPTRPHLVARPKSVKTRRQINSAQSEEELTSSDDDDGFIVPDEDGDLTMDDLASAEPEEKQEEDEDPGGLMNMQRRSRDTSFELIDLTQASPQAFSDENYPIVNLITPDKNRTRPVSTAENADDPPTSKTVPDLNFTDVAMIGDCPPKYWTEEKDRWRLVISILYNLTHDRRSNLFILLQHIDDDVSWKLSVQKTLDNPLEDENLLHTDGEIARGFDLTRVFFSFLKCKAYGYDRIIDMGSQHVKYIRDEKEKHWPEFCNFVRKHAPYFPQINETFKASLSEEPLDFGEDYGENDDDSVSSSRQPSVGAKHTGTRKIVVYDQKAVDLREREQKRLEEQEARRDKLRKTLATLGTMSADKSRLIINESKQEEQPFIYINKDIGKRIKDHQIDGVRFMWNQIVLDLDVRQGCLLAHTMGLGKTMQVITLLVTIMEASTSTDNSVRAQIPEDLRQSKTLVLCPSGLVNNWMDELLSWAPEGVLGKLRKIEANMTLLDRELDLKGWSNEGGVLIIGYNMFMKLFVDGGDNRDNLVNGPNIVIADEAHSLKNRKGRLFACCSQFRTESRIALTGSPLANNVEEYHSMIEWLAPTFLGPPAEFKAIYAVPIQRGLWSDSGPGEKRKALKMLQVLKETVAPKVHRATIKSCLKHDLPAKYEFNLYVPPTRVQRDVYKRYLAVIERQRENSSDKLQQVQLFSIIGTLSLICNHPQCFSDKINSVLDQTQKGESSFMPPEVVADFREDTELYNINASLSRKVELLFVILDEARSMGDKVLVFSQSLLTLDFLSKVMRQQKRIFSRLDGKTDIGKRQDLIKGFNVDKSQEVYLISTTAGGVGLNIHGANRVVIFDFKWNPVQEQQAVGRAYRIGQEKTVFVYRFIIAGTFEDDLQDRAVFKTQLASRVVDKKNPLSWSKRQGELLHPIRQTRAKNLESFKGKDRILDKMMEYRASDGDITIKNIVSTDTFEEEDPNVDLTAEERKEADELINLNRLRLTHPQKYHEQLRKPQQQFLYVHQAPVPVTSPIVSSTPKPAESGLSRGPETTAATNGARHARSNQGLNGTFDMPSHCHSERGPKGVQEISNRSTSPGEPQTPSAPLPITGANTFFGASKQQPSRSETHTSSPRSQNASNMDTAPPSSLNIFGQPNNSQAKADFEIKLCAALSCAQTSKIPGTYGDPIAIARFLTATVHEMRIKESLGFLPDISHWRLLEQSLEHDRFVLAAVSGHLSASYLAFVKPGELYRRIKTLESLNDDEFRSRLRPSQKEQDPDNLQNIGRSSVSGKPPPSPQAVQDLAAMREAADNRKRRATRLPTWANEALSEKRGPSRFSRKPS